MKNDIYTREELYTRIFSHLPEAPKGKKLAEILWLRVTQGGIYLDPTNSQWTEWTPINMSADKVPVAQFQDTHREDGTPIDIDPLPEPPKGFRVEYIHISNLVSGEENCDTMWRFCPSEEIWEESAMDNPCRAGKHYARLYKIKQPTTLADLVGKHGQNNVWLHTETNGSISSAIDCRDGKIHYVDGKTIECLIKYAYRWSNSPFTSWADANEFTPETK